MNSLYNSDKPRKSRTAGTFKKRNKKKRNRKPQSKNTEKVTEIPEKKVVRKARVTPEGVFTDLLPEIQRSLAEEGYCKPTPIQTKAIPHVLSGRDMIGCAQTGTGKTAAFTLPILQFLSQKTNHERKPKRPLVLVLAPTRELAGQINDNVEKYGRYLKLKSTVVFGGVGINQQIKALREGVDLLIATPGRLMDLMKQKAVFLDGIEFFVLDEADRMLDMGFIHDIKKIIKYLPEKRQTLFFSATMEKGIDKLARELVNDPVSVTITPSRPAAELVDQKLFYVEKKSKFKLLKSLAADNKMYKVIIFTQMKHVANKLAKQLKMDGESADAIHGNKSQLARTKALNAFKDGRVRFLVATDIAARGIDVDDVTHVVNYDMPIEPETYIHRIGRTARAGKNGVAYSFCSADERGCLKGIQRLLKNDIPLETDHPYHNRSNDISRSVRRDSSSKKPGARKRAKESVKAAVQKKKRVVRKKSYFAKSRTSKRS